MKCTGRILAAVVVTSLAAGPAIAQSGPALQTMPLPPSAGDPPPKDAAPAKSAKSKPSRTKVKTEAAAEGTKTRANRTSSQQSGYDRPSRYVPEEFDRPEESSGGSRMKPMMGEGGRAGMGMQF